MELFYQNLLSVRLTKNLLLALLFLGTTFAAKAQIYRANNLSGLNESPSNASPATGSAIVTIVGTTMRVQAVFSGLIGTTTASHIHAATAVPGVGTAGVATTTPYFPGFPIGVTSGTYDMTFDMTLASSYNASFVTANGASTASAFAALKTALNNGTSYFNIHTGAFPSGEIRGFLIACPTITVSIPDAFALPQGVLPNTVYPAYAPAASLTLATSVSGGTGPYIYNWSDGSIASSVTVSPIVSTQYTVTVQDQNGCTGTSSKTVDVVDIAGGKKGDKIIICHKEKNTLTIDFSAVSAHLAHGDMLGSCLVEPHGSNNLRKGITEEDQDVLSVLALPNPSLTYFDLKIHGNVSENIQVRVYDMMGRVIETKDSVQSNQMLRLGNSYTPGMYVVEIVQGAQKQTLKLLKGQ